MNQQELEKLAITEYPNGSDKVYIATCRVAFIAGYSKCIQKEEWKNLYAEGLEVGMEMLRQAIEQNKKYKKNAECWELLVDRINDWSEQNEDGPIDEVIASIWWEIQNDR